MGSEISESHKSRMHTCFEGDDKWNLHVSNIVAVFSTTPFFWESVTLHSISLRCLKHMRND